MSFLNVLILLLTDSTGKHSVVSLVQRIYWSHEVIPDAAQASLLDKTGNTAYLLACRASAVKPCADVLLQSARSHAIMMPSRGLRSTDAIALAAALAINATLTELSLEDNPLGPAGHAALAGVLAGGTGRVATARLAKTRAGAAGGEAWAAAVRAGGALTHLDLRANRLGDRAASLVRILRTCSESCVCTHVCTHVCTYACMQIRVYVCLPACMHAYLHANRHVCMHACVRACMQCSVHTMQRAYMHVCVHTYIHSPVYIHA